VQRLLLPEKELSLEKAYQVCTAEETASNDTSVLKGEQVHKISAQKKHPKGKTRYAKQQCEKQHSQEQRLCFP